MPLAMEKRLRVIEGYIRTSGRFLDCGCGSGLYVLTLKERFALDAHGVEFNAEKVEAARLNPKLKDRVARGDLQTLQFPDCSWDYAMLNEVLEHVPDDRRALHEVYRVLEPGGLLFIFSPNRWFPFETHGVRLKGSRRGVPIWVPFIPYIPLALGNRFFEYWARNYWQDELAAMARESGFSIIDRAFVWLTFEGISHSQPRLIKVCSPLLRLISNTLERLPILRRFGVSQALVCKK